MGSPYSRLGIGISINGIAVLFLGYALLGDGEDIHLNLNRTYLALTMVAPPAALLLLTVSAKQSLAANYVVLGAFAALLIAVALPPAHAPVEERAVQPQEQSKPARALLIPAAGGVALAPGEHPDPQWRDIKRDHR